MVVPPPQRLQVGVLVVLVVLGVEVPGALHKCIFDEVQARVRVIRPAHSSHNRTQHFIHAAERTDHQEHGRNPREMDSVSPASPQPIRIRSWVPRESNSLSEAEKERVEAAVEEAVRTVSSLLSVNRASGPLLLSRDINKYCKFLWRDSSTANYNRCGRANNRYRCETCLGVKIPDDHLAGCGIYATADSPNRTELWPEGAGLAHTDFILYLQVQATDKCRAEPKVLAYAVHCQTDTHGRPVAGVVVICRDRLAGDTFSHRAAVQTVVHELFHALGFSRDLFHTWTDCSSTSQGGCSPRGRVTHPDGSGQMRIYSPSVISALQRHLAASDPELGAPLENLDVPVGRASSHWESRVMRGSIMAPVLGDPATIRIDPITLGALQDTGWYAVHLGRAHSSVWGEGEGAMFGSVSTCQDNSSSFFCTGSGFGCHYLHLHKGECQTDQYLEGCRVYKPLKNGSECWKEENGRKPAVEDTSGELFGFDSRCFFSSLTRQNHSELVLSSSSVEGRCYRHRCTGPNRYQIQVSGAEWADCPAGGTVQIKGYQGVVSCPDRRLCLHSDVTPPSDQSVGVFPASPASGPSESPASVQSVSWSVVTALGVTGAVSLLAAAMVTHRKCPKPRRVQVHTAPQGTRDLQL